MAEQQSSKSLTWSADRNLELILYNDWVKQNKKAAERRQHFLQCRYIIKEKKRFSVYEKKAVPV